MKNEYVIITFVKNENAYITEWLDHYFALGFDTIYIADNNDSEDLEGFLQTYPRRNDIVILDYRNKTISQETVIRRVYTEQLKNKCKWFLICDIDEFLILPGFTSISDYVAQPKFKDASSISFNWKLYGDSDLVMPEVWEPCKKRFNKTIDGTSIRNFNRTNNQVKTMTRGDAKLNIMAASNHKTMCFGKMVHANGQEIKYNQPDPWSTDFIDYSAGHINHYLTKTIVEFVRRKIKFNLVHANFCNGKIIVILDDFRKAGNIITEEKLNILGKVWPSTFTDDVLKKLKEMFL